MSLVGLLEATGATTVKRIGDREGNKNGGTHTLQFVKRESSGQETLVLSLSVFQRVQIGIRVVEGRAGDRFLDISLAYGTSEEQVLVEEQEGKEKDGAEKPRLGGSQEKGNEERHARKRSAPQTQGRKKKGKN